MKRTLTIISALIILITMTACGSSDKSDRTEQNMNSAEISAEDTISSDDEENTLNAVSQKRFTDCLSSLGEVQDMTGQMGFNACLISGDTGISYIYMYLPDKDMAESLLTDEDGDGSQDAALSILEEGSNYKYAETRSASEKDGSPIYSYSLRADCMLITVSGEASREDIVRTEARNALEKLGYDAPL